MISILQTSFLLYFSYEKTNNLWNMEQPMNLPRYQAASVKLTKDDFWVVGNYTYSVLKVLKLFCFEGQTIYLFRKHVCLRFKKIHR